MSGINFLLEGPRRQAVFTKAGSEVGMLATAPPVLEKVALLVAV